MQRSISYTVYKKNSLLVHGNKAKYQKFMKNIGGRWNSRIKGEEPGWVIPSDSEELLKAYINKVDPEIVPVPTDNVPVTDSKTDTEDKPQETTETDTPKESSNASESAVLENLSSFIDENPQSSHSTDNENNSNISEPLSDSEIKTPEKPIDIIEPSAPKKNYEELIKQKLKEKTQQTRHTLESLSKRNDNVPKQISPSETYDCFTFYRIFSKKPRKFRKLYYNEDDGDSEVEEDVSSTYSSSDEEDDMYKYIPKPITPVKHKKEYSIEDENKTIDEIVKNMKKLQKQMYDLQINIGK